MKGLFTNCSNREDFVQNAINQMSQRVSNVYIAVAFFTESSVVEEMLNNNVHVRLIVRLGFPTNPTALKKLINNENIEIRYFSSQSFHPKLYIFGNESLLVGSANLTKAALLTNQEITVSIDSDDERFSELVSLFSDYWDESRVLTLDGIKKYESIMSKYKSINSDLIKIQREVDENIGVFDFSNIERGNRKRKKEDIFVEDYRKIYQETKASFNKIKSVYIEMGMRRESSVPIRVEIDSFISFVREKYAEADSWGKSSIGWDPSKVSLLKNHIKEWIDSESGYFENTIVSTNYPLIKSVFGSERNLNNANYEDIVEGLLVLHSFRERLRFFGGGLPTLKREFMDLNDLEKVKSSLSYLLFDKKDDIPTRMYRMISVPEYKLAEFGQSNVQELIGWVSSEDYPVINGRTTKVLRYYGFEVNQL